MPVGPPDGFVGADEQGARRIIICLDPRLDAVDDLGDVWMQRLAIAQFHRPLWPLGIRLRRLDAFKFGETRLDGRLHLGAVLVEKFVRMRESFERRTRSRQSFGSRRSLSPASRRPWPRSRQWVRSGQRR